jgi:Zn-dependent protease with chaperone function
LAPANHEHVRAVLGHEQAHRARHDPLRRFLASLAFAFHLPGVARAIELELARAQEMAADDDAARMVGSRARVARALVALTRARRREPSLGLAFAELDVEARVRCLLEPRPASSTPGPGALLVALAAALVLIAITAETVHHAVELVLGVLGG